MQFAQDDCVYTEEQIRRVATTAFEEAQARNLPLTNIDKANILATSRFWRDDRGGDLPAHFRTYRFSTCWWTMRRTSLSSIRRSSTA